MNQATVFADLAERLKVVEKLDWDEQFPIWHADSGTQADADLMLSLYRRYKQPVIPPCRLCGAELVVGRMGTGSTVYACDKGDSKHYAESGYSDYKEGGDAAVLELIKRFTVLREVWMSESLDSMAMRNEYVSLRKSCVRTA